MDEMVRVFALMAAMAWCAQAGEYAVLASGARLRVDRHEAAGDKVRLFLHGGSTEMPAGEVTGFEAEEQVAAKAAEPMAAARRLRRRPTRTC